MPWSKACSVQLLLRHGDEAVAAVADVHTANAALQQTRPNLLEWMLSLCLYMYPDSLYAVVDFRSTSCAYRVARAIVMPKP